MNLSKVQTQIISTIDESDNEFDGFTQINKTRSMVNQNGDTGRWLRSVRSQFRVKAGHSRGPFSCGWWVG